jgi:hypothetical protein
MRAFFQLIVALLFISTSAEAKRNEGFFEIDTIGELHEAAREKLKNSVFKIQIGSIANIHGTAFFNFDRWTYAHKCSQRKVMP